MGDEREGRLRDRPVQRPAPLLHDGRQFLFGVELEPQVIPEWDVKRALATLDVELIPFDSADGNCQGFARKRQIAINPLAQLPAKTLFHEAAHVLLGHTGESDFARRRYRYANHQRNQQHGYGDWKIQIPNLPLVDPGGDDGPPARL